MLKTDKRFKKKTRLPSTFPRRNGYSRLRQQEKPEEEGTIYGAIAARSGLRMVGGFYGIFSAIFEKFEISCLMGRHHVKGGSECHLTDQFFRLEQWSNISRLNAKEVFNAAKKWKLHIPSHGWNSQNLWVRTASPFTRGCPERGEEQEILQRKSDESHCPIPFQEDSTREDEEAENFF